MTNSIASLRRNSKPLSPSAAARRFMTLGVTEEDDRSELAALLDGLTSGARYAFFSVRCLGAAAEAVAVDLQLASAEVDRLLCRCDRALEAIGEVPVEVAARAVARLSDEACAAMRENVGLRRPEPARKRRGRPSPG